MANFLYWDLSSWIILTALGIMLGIQAGELLIHVIKIVAHKKYKADPYRCARIVLSDIGYMLLPISTYVFLYVIMGYTL